LHEVAAAGGRHGRVGGQFAARLSKYGRETGLGDVYTSGTGFVIAQSPLTLLVPDVVFIKNESLPDKVVPVGFFRTPPDVAVEVRSPSKGFVDLVQKVAAFLRFDVPLVWVADVDRRTVTAFSQKSILVYDPGEILDGGDVLPGFNVPVDDFFP
jgi:Uma2 family endonuclease